MTSTVRSRARTAVSAIVAMFAGMVVPLVVTATPAAASNLGGAVSRPEILSRAQNWVNRQLTYTQTGPWATDPDGPHTYRRDCSGFVSMVWHLGSSLITNQFLDRARRGEGMHVISRDALKHGDAMVRDSDGSGPDGHMELFSHWVNPSNHNAGAYVYSFNSDGETVRNPYANNNRGNLGRNDNAEMNTYTFIRYNKVDSERVSDFSGDGFADVLRVDAGGNLLYHPNNGLTIPSTGQPIGAGWGTFKHVMAADFSGDGFADVLGVDAAGNLLYYPNNNLGLSGPITLESGGWDAYSHVMAGDFSGDGHTDVLAVDTAGNLQYFPNNGMTIKKNTGQTIGVGWGSFKHVVAADFSGDGHADILGVDGDGNLRYYPNQNFTLPSSVILGTNWDGSRQMFASDFSGDEYADIFQVNAAGDLVYYPNNNLTISDATSRKLAGDWASSSHVM